MSSIRYSSQDIDVRGALDVFSREKAPPLIRLLLSSPLGNQGDGFLNGALSDLGEPIAYVSLDRKSL